MRRLTAFWLAMAWLAAGMPQSPGGRQAEIPQGAALKSVAPLEAVGKPARVSDISITPGSAGELTINVATTKSATFRVYRFDHPDRLVLDFEGMTNSVRRSVIPVASSVVKDVRVGQYQSGGPEIVRVVVDLEGNPVFDAQAYEGGVRLEVKPRSTNGLEAAGRTATLPHEASVLPGAPAPASPHETARASAAAATDAPTHKTSTPRAVPHASAPSLELAARRDMPATGYSGTVPSRALSGEAAPQQTPLPTSPEALKAAQAAEVLHAGAMAPSPGGAESATPAPAGNSGPAFTGEAISLNLKDVDLKDFFRLIHEISGLNILVDPNVSGSVTMVLDNVPWDQALDIVLKNNGLGKVLEGNVLRIAKLETLVAEQETANKMAAERLKAAPLVTIFRPVNYGSANDIATLLKTWSGGAGRSERDSSAGPLSPRGSVLVDKRTNTLIISDVAAQIPKVEETIESARPRRR